MITINRILCFFSHKMDNWVYVKSRSYISSAGFHVTTKPFYIRSCLRHGCLHVESARQLPVKGLIK